MAKKNVHVVPHGDKWAVKSTGSEKAAKLTNTQSDAIDIAKQMAKNNSSELFIHRPNGQIRERNTYGNDPFPPQG